MADICTRYPRSRIIGPASRTERRSRNAVLADGYDEAGLKAYLATLADLFRQPDEPLPTLVGNHPGFPGGSANEASVPANEKVS